MVAYGERAVVVVRGATTSGYRWSEEFAVDTILNRVCCIFSLSIADVWATVIVKK